MDGGRPVVCRTGKRVGGGGLVQPANRGPWGGIGVRVVRRSSFADRVRDGKLAHFTGSLACWLARLGRCACRQLLDELTNGCCATANVPFPQKNGKTGILFLLDQDHRQTACTVCGREQPFGSTTARVRRVDVSKCGTALFVRSSELTDWSPSVSLPWLHGSVSKRHFRDRLPLIGRAGDQAGSEIARMDSIGRPGSGAATPR
jgi:hypothetical protein